MRRPTLFVLVATIGGVVAVGGALATTNVGGRANGPQASTPAAGGWDTFAPTPVLAGDVPPSQPSAKASATPHKNKPKPKPKPATYAASTSVADGDNDCWDDCGDPGGSNCGLGASAGHGSVSMVDDDGDGDGGDCGEDD